MQLSIVGEGADRPLLERAVLEKKLQDKIIFKGIVLKENMVQEIQAHDALIMFSNYESFCVVIAEAMACGKPVISSCCGGLTSFITNELGCLVEPRDETGLSEAILKLRKNQANYNPQTIRQFATDHFSQEVIAGKLKEIYQSVLSAG